MTHHCSSCKTNKPIALFDCKADGTTPLATCQPCREKRSAGARSKADTSLHELEFDVSSMKVKVEEHEKRLNDLDNFEIGEELLDGGADVAEVFPKADPNEPIEPGDLVEQRDNAISRTIVGDGTLFVISTKPFVVMNRVAAGLPGLPVVMIGQAPVKVIGAVGANQPLIPSGRNDGTTKGSGSAPEARGIITLEASSDVGVKLVLSLINAGTANAHAKSDDTVGSSWVHARKLDDESVSDVTGDSLSPPFVVSSHRNPTDEADGPGVQAKLETMARDMAAMHEKMADVMVINSLLLFGTPNLRAVTANLGSVPGGSRGLVGAARTMQRIVRGVIARVHFRWIRASTKRLQAHARTWSARALLRTSQAAVTHVAAAVRRRTQSLHLSKVRVATVRIQAMVRTASSRNWYCAKQAAVTMIASYWRCYLVLTTTAIGKVLSRARVTLRKLEATQGELKASKPASEGLSRVRMPEGKYLIKHLHTRQYLGCVRAPGYLSVPIGNHTPIGRQPAGDEPTIWHVKRVGVNIYGIQCYQGDEQGKFLNVCGGGTADGTPVQLWGDNATAASHNAWCFTTSVQSDGTKVTGIQSIYNGKFLSTEAFIGDGGAPCKTSRNRAVPGRDTNGVFHSSSWELISLADHQRNNAERSTEAAP